MMIKSERMRWAEYVAGMGRQGMLKKIGRRSIDEMIILK
jgi:hypothetical protein